MPSLAPSRRAPIAVTLLVLSLLPTLRLCAQAPTEIAPGIFAFTPNNTTDFFPDGNTTVIIGSKAVLVVDAPSVRLSREHVKWIRTKTSLPVKYVVNARWHLDHMSGNQVYAEQFPGVEIIASGETRDYSVWRNPSYLAQQLALTPEVVAGQRKKVIQQRATGKDPDDGSPYTPDAAAHDMAGLDQEALEWSTWRETRLVQPTLTFEGDLDLDLAIAMSSSGSMSDTRQGTSSRSSRNRAR